MKKNPVRVLVVDDSALMRKLIPQMLATDDSIEVVGTAMDGTFCLKKIEELKPNVVTLDLEMPGMNGIDALKEIMRRQPVPVIVFTKGGGQWLERIADIGCDAVGIDWTTDIGAARRRIGARVAIQGNLDPIALLSTPKVIESQARAILAAAGNEPGHVFNLGHGIVPSTPVENVEALVECVHQATGRPDFDARATYREMAENRAPRGSSRS